jgi:hypothetical protein
MAADREHAHHVAARAHRQRQLDAGALGRRPLPHGDALLEAAPWQRVGGAARRVCVGLARGRAGERQPARLALDHPQPRLLAHEPGDQRVEHGRRRLDQRERSRERLRGALARHREPLAAPPLAEVSDVGGEDHAALDVGRDHHHLDRDQRAVRAHRGRLAATAEVGAVPGGHELAQPAAQLVAQRPGHDRVGHLAPEHLGAAVAEQPPRRGVELDDAAFVVRGEDAVERGVQDQRLADLARPELVLPLARLVEGAHGERERRRSRPLRRLGVHEAADAVARVAPVHQELDAHAVGAFHLAGQTHHLAHHPQLGVVAGQREAQADLGAELEPARRFEQHAPRADVQHDAVVLVGVGDEARPVPQPDRDPVPAPSGHAQQLFEPPVPQEGVDRRRDHGVRPGAAQRGLVELRAAREHHDRGRARELVPAQLPRELDRVDRRQVHHHHVRVALLGDVERLAGGAHVTTLDVGPSEHRLRQLSGQAVRPDHENLQHAGEV